MRRERIHGRVGVREIARGRAYTPSKEGTNRGSTARKKQGGNQFLYGGERGTPEAQDPKKKEGEARCVADHSFLFRNC